MRKQRIESKKAEPKKIESKKVEPKKIESKKAEPKKIESKRVEPKKIESKKIEKIEQKDPAPADAETTPAKSNNDVFFELQYAGKAISYTEIVDRARQACGGKPGKLDIYVKPEENRVYFVSDGNEGCFEI
ncbi:MAG: hypothetical protein IJU87_00465 [Lachnospiraceae bacterium]|nr:hypothetical protein [Lachnospiraceae bacterium]